MERLRDIILSRWSACRTEAEKSIVLDEISAARHEIAFEYLWAEPQLRIALENMQGLCEAIMRGQYSIASLNWREPDTGRTAPLVGLAGMIAMLLIDRAQRQERQRLEYSGTITHEARYAAAERARRFQVRVREGATYRVDPVDPLEVQCPICLVEPKVRCK